MIQHIDIPDNIANYISQHNGSAINITISNASANHGYAHIMWYVVRVSILTRTCHRCGYDVIWNPDDSESKCQRHSYDAWRYDDVFIWSDQFPHLSLEEAFDDWLSAQPTGYMLPMKRKVYGKIGW